MCRMLGIIGVNPITPFKHLIDAECSLLRQAELGRQGGWMGDRLLFRWNSKVV